MIYLIYVITFVVFLYLGIVMGSEILRYWHWIQIKKGFWIITNPKEVIARTFFREDHS